ncbi:MAG: WS/DGAT/MGAT family O-acyltransferase [Acidimicrobiales bacterium]
MRRLTAIDALFLYQEDVDPANHQHTLKVSIIDPATAGHPYEFAETKETVRRRLPVIPFLRWRLVTVPFRVNHPVWIDDPDFDLDFHVRRVGCPAPGGDRELGELISDIASRPLDRARPLWELYMVEGLAGGRVAAVAKVHHALADGVASAEALQRIFDPGPGGADPDLPAGPLGEPVPSRRRVLASALADLAHHLTTELAEIIRVTRRVRQQKALWGAGPADLPPKRFASPPTPLNRIITPHRLFAFTSVPLDDARAVKDAFGCTINDVFLATVAGALRRYLDERGVLPAAPLVGGVPVSIRTPEQAGTWGNRLAMMYVSLRSDIDDPIERLRAAQAASQASKDDFERTRGARIENWIEFMPVSLARLILRRYGALARRGGPSAVNVVVSNVPGPRTPLYANDARMEAFYSIGPLNIGVGLNITVWSYVDQLNFSLLACREAVPDLWTLTDFLRDGVAELRKASVHARA